MSINPITTVFSKLDASNDLLINEVCSDSISLGIMPWCKYFLAEEQPPWCITLLCSLLLGVLLTLRYCIHDVVTPTAQR